jgi:hypothetical protein
MVFRESELQPLITVFEGALVPETSFVERACQGRPSDENLSSSSNPRAQNPYAGPGIVSETPFFAKIIASSFAG